MAASSGDFTTLVLIAVFFGLFIFSASLRIKNARKRLRETGLSKRKIFLEKLDIVFSGIFLAWSIIVLAVFALNYGQ